MTDWIDIGALADIPVQGARLVETGEGQLALFRTADDRVFALLNRCPHRGGPLSEGIVHGHKVTCPLHNWVVDLETGEAVAPDRGCVPSRTVQVRQGRVLLAANGEVLAMAERHDG